MADPVKGKTAAGRRREERARATRERIVAAATALFLDRGYVATTIDVIAARAGVAPATVYQAFGTKSAILARALDESIAGDAEWVPMLDRDWVAVARREPDAHRRLAIVVEHTTPTAARTAPLKAVMRDAAATEPAIRELLDADDARRLVTQSALVEIVLGRPAPEAATAIFYLLVNSQAYQLAAQHLRWDEEAWRHCLVEVLNRQLLGADPT